MSSKTFNQILNGVSKQGDHYEAQIPRSWMQGRASFGGLVTALAVEAMQQALYQGGGQQAGQKLPLRALQVLFVGPVGEQPIRIETTKLRQGKNVTSMRADLIQDGNVSCSVMACFGASRVSELSLEAKKMPIVADPESLKPFQYVEGKTPSFTQYFDMRWAEGDSPFTGCKERTHGIWTCFHEKGPASIAHLIAIADIPPPIGLSMLTTPAVGSSLTWTLEFLGNEWQANADGWWYVRTELAQSSQGYSQQTYSIWTPDGKPVALGRQVMTVFG